jgi:hypothetical protein
MCDHHREEVLPSLSEKNEITLKCIFSSWPHFSHSGWGIPKIQKAGEGGAEYFENDIEG